MPKSTENPYTIELNPAEAVLMHDVIEGTITSIDRDNKTVDAILDEPYYPRNYETDYGKLEKHKKYEHLDIEPITEVSGAKIIYNCQSENLDPASAFHVNDKVLIYAVNGEYYCIGFPDEIRRCGEILYVNLNNYVILWDMEKEDILDVPGVTFPCPSDDPNFVDFLSRLKLISNVIFPGTAQKAFSNIPYFNYCKERDSSVTSGCTSEVCSNIEHDYYQILELSTEYVVCDSSQPGCSYANDNCCWVCNAKIFQRRDSQKLTLFDKPLAIELFFTITGYAQHCLGCAVDPRERITNIDQATVSLYKSPDFENREKIASFTDDSLASNNYYHSEGYNVSWRAEYCYSRNFSWGLPDYDYIDYEDAFIFRGVTDTRYAVVIIISNYIHITYTNSSPTEYGVFSPQTIAYLEKGNNVDLINPIEYNESESLEEAIVSLINIAKADLSEGETFRPDDLDLKIYR